MKLAYMPILYRYPTAEHLMSTVMLLDHCKNSGVAVYYRAMRGDALIERTRGRAATSFLLGTTHDVLLQVDDDIAFKPEDAVQIAEQAMTHDIVCGLYLTRSKNAGVPTSYLDPGSKYDLFSGDSTPQPIRWGGGGFMAVHRRVFEHLAKDLPLCHPGSDLEHYPFYQTMIVPEPVEPHQPILLSEDWALCERARRAGFNVMVNPNVRLTHMGTTAYTMEDILNPDPARLALTIERQLNGDLTTIGHPAPPSRSSIAQER